MTKPKDTFRFKKAELHGTTLMKKFVDSAEERGYKIPHEMKLWYPFLSKKPSKVPDGELRTMMDRFMERNDFKKVNRKDTNTHITFRFT